MANKRYITTNFWRDNFVDGLDPEQKLLFLYLICNPATNLCGIYELPIRIISSDTGIEEKDVEKIFVKFSEKKRAYYVEGWVVLPNAPKHQELKSDRICVGIERELANVSEKVIEMIDTLSIPYTYPTHTNTILRLRLKPRLEPKLRPKPNGIYTPDFEKFFSAYPNRKGKKAAYKAWDRARDKPPVNELIAVIEIQKTWRTWKEGYIPHPSTWLNQGRWADEPDPDQKKSIVVKSKSVK